MITITLTRIKKAFLHPGAALHYIKNYFQGGIIKLRYKFFKKINLEKQLFPLTSRNWESHFIYKTNSKFFIDDENFLKEIVNQNFVLPTAERILLQEFGFLGEPPKILKNINWREDIKSGHVWSNDFYLDLREDLNKDFNKGWDIKMVWELSRFNYLIPLALAYYRTGEEKYLNKWQELILDWIKNNPVYYGPNWLNAMEAAIRVCNWIFSWEIIIARNKKQEARNKLGKEFLETFLASLYEHGRFIYFNLEYAPIRSNHYVSDIVGLIYLGVMFPEFKESKKWLKKGVKALEAEMKYQVYDDGVDYELSAFYHRYKTELFLWASWLCKINNIKLSEGFWLKLKKMVVFNKSIIKPNGLASQIGDTDDGRLHIVWEDFYSAEKRNHFALFKLCQWARGEKLANEIKTSKGFAEGGIYIMRSRDFYLITGRGASCYGRGGSHIHNDMLSFELNFFGEDFIVDPGTYVYTSDLKERNRFRSTKAHNTVLLDNQEQNPFFRDPFYIEQKAKFKVNQFAESENKILFDGQHSGYERLEEPIIHKRRFVFYKQENKLEIYDSFLGEGEHFLEWNFHLSPKIKLWLKGDINESREIILVGENSSLLFLIPKILNCVIMEDEFSPSYGVKIPSRALRFSGFLNKDSQKEFEFKIEPIR